MLEEWRPSPSSETRGGARPTQSRRSAEAPTVGLVLVPPPPAHVDPTSDAHQTKRPSTKDYGRVGVPLRITEHQTFSVCEH